MPFDQIISCRVICIGFCVLIPLPWLQMNLWTGKRRTPVFVPKSIGSTWTLWHEHTRVLYDNLSRSLHLGTNEQPNLSFYFLYSFFKWVMLFSISLSLSHAHCPNLVCFRYLPAFFTWFFLLSFRIFGVESNIFSNLSMYSFCCDNIVKKLF